jgi:hypothetical protein
VCAWKIFNGILVCGSTACQQTWVLTSGVNVAGGTVVPAASTVAACQAACIASATCQSIDFTAGAAAGQQCWLATTQTTTGTFVGNAHYDLTRAATSCSSSMYPRCYKSILLIFLSI